MASLIGLIEEGVIVNKLLIGRSGLDWDTLVDTLTVKEMALLMKMRHDLIQDMRDGITPMVVHLWVR